MVIYALKILKLNSKMSGGPQSTRISPRKFSEKIALLNKKEREANAKFEQIINEVHSTISHPQQLQRGQRRQQPTMEATRLGPQLSSDEFQTMLESSAYQAAHSDSLEEIERVYENLMKSVGQCEYPQAISNTNQQPLETNKACLQQQFITRTTANSNHSTPNTISRSANSLLSRDVGPFYAQQQQQQQQQRNNQFHGTNPDLNNNNNNHLNPRRPNINNNIACGPAKSAIRSAAPIANKSLFSSHNMLETHVSSSYLPHASDQQEICMPDSQTRGRVVSFGSATRDRYRGAPISQHHLLLASDQQQQQQQQQQHQQVAGALLCDKNHAHELGQPHLTQYLEEPSGDPCRQKSCSDPQLNVLAPAQYSMGPMDQCKSDNRLAVSSSSQQPPGATFGHTTTPFSCCSSTGSGPIEIAKTNAHQNSNAEYFVTTSSSGSKVNPSSQSGQVSTTTSSGVHFDPCDTTSSSSRTSELPGIKICTIGDSGQQYGASNQRQVFNSDESPSSRDSSLPDIANLRFGNNSNGTSPEKHRQPQQQQQHHSYEPLNNWPAANIANGQYCPIKQEETVQMVDSCEAPDGSWQQFGAPSNEVAMEVQTGDQLVPVANRSNQAASQETACWSNNQPPPMSSQNQQNALKAANNLSSSDYGFGSASSAQQHHHQQGNLMICTSSELYNNIFRSRSHSNIDYLAKQAGGQAKRAHLYAENLPQFEEHHTSQYCLQTAEQAAVMNVRRIEELKAQGTSTSPLNSSSNLNSPQSDVNSPGGSSTTTEQCESAMLFASASNQQDFYQINAKAGADGAAQFVQYAPTMRDLHQHQRQHQQQLDETHPKQCVQIISQQSFMGESFMEQDGDRRPVQPLCQPSTTSQAALFDSASPSSTTADCLNHINNNER